MSRSLRGRGPAFGLTVFPSPSARKEGQIGFTPFLRCTQCGLSNDSRKTSWSNVGEGFGDPVSITVTRFKSQTQAQANTKDHPVVSGCRFCGSLRWRDNKVTPLPDGNRRPSSEYRSKFLGRR